MNKRVEQALNDQIERNKMFSSKTNYEMELKKDGINPHLFAHIETVSEMAIKVAEGDKEGAEAIAAAANDDFFEAVGKKEEEIDIDIDKI